MSMVSGFDNLESFGTDNDTARSLLFSNSMELCMSWNKIFCL